jgi:1-acyl-sn-glycerol-3-phosphate acyltransferase
LGISWLWFFGATFLTQFPTFAKDVLGGGEGVTTLLLGIFSVGIGVGSLLCERLSGHKVEIGLVPFGSIGMTVFAIDLFFASHNMVPGATLSVPAFLADAGNWRVMADLFLLALFGGFYSVPLYALIQTRCEPSHRSRVIAANNILNALFMVASAGMAIVLLKAGFTIPQLFLVTGLLNAVVAIYIYTLVPEFLMRFLAWLLIHTVYRLRVQGLDKIPDEGPAVIVCNHVSFVDPVVIAGACRRPIRFVMDHGIFKVPLLNFIFRTMRTIPITSGRENPKVKERAFAQVAEALRNGELVGIFPEGGITTTGELQNFRPGIARIVEETPVPVIPMALRGLWGSFFSRKGGAAMSKPFRRGVWSRIELVAGDAVAPAAVELEDLRSRVLALRGENR